MSAIIKLMDGQVKYLPIKDQELALEFLGRREFNSLFELVDSLIRRIVKDRRKEEEFQKYKELDLDELNNFIGMIVTYLEQLRIPEQDEEEYYESDSYQENELDFYD